MRARDPTRTAVGRLHDNLEEKVEHVCDLSMEVVMERIVEGLGRNGNRVWAVDHLDLMNKLGVRTNLPLFKRALDDLAYRLKRIRMQGERGGFYVYLCTNLNVAKSA